jgi:hypothetical protein
MINHNAKRKAGQAIQEARAIDDALREQGGNTITVEVIDTPEFWAGINLLTLGEYKLLPSTTPTTVTLERK